MTSRRVLGTVTAILGALIFLGVLAGTGPAVAPTIVAAALLATGPALAHRDRRRAHNALRARFDRGTLRY